jgi:hypothetical protein
MKNSQATNLAGGFGKWSVDHPPTTDDSATNDAAYLAGATPSTDPQLDEPKIVPQSHQPWRVPGMGTL